MLRLTKKLSLIHCLPDIPQEMGCLKPLNAKTGAGIAVKEVTMMCQRCYNSPLGVLM